MKKVYLGLALSLMCVFNMYAQATPEAPQLEFVCELKVKLNPAVIVGETPHGIRRIIPIIGGMVEGPAIKAEILNGGADWQIVRSDGVTELEAHYQMKTDDGVIIYIKNTGIRAATPEVAIFICKAQRNPDNVAIQVWKIK